MRFATAHRWMLYGTFTGLALTGLAWFWLDLAHGLGPSPDDAIQLAKAWLGKGHGAFAMLGLVGFGSALAIHVPTGWVGNARRASGLALVATTLLLAVTGFLLYYAAGEDLRAWSAWIHLGAGIATCAAFAWHRLARAARPTP
jgi:hypothetical protein